MRPTGGGLHDVPEVADLVASVAEFLERDVVAATEGQLRFHARVAANVLRIVEREILLGPDQEASHRAGLAALGLADEAQLAAALRRGELDDRAAGVRAFVTETVRAKLAVSNPRHLGSAGTRQPWPKTLTEDPEQRP